MEAKNIRIGNSFGYYDNTSEGEILAIKASTMSNNGTVMISIKGGGYTQAHLDDLTPIILTDENKERLGFEKDGFGAYSKSIDLFEGKVENNDRVKKLFFSSDYLFLKEGFEGKRNEDNLVVLWNKDIKKEFYVHELQNLWHALMGTELILKNK